MRGTTTGRARAAVVAVVVVVVAAGACRSEERGSRPQDRAPEVDAMWTEDGAVVHLAPPATYLLPGPDAPPGTVLSALSIPDPAHGTSSAEELLASDDVAAQTLYADPGASDPLAGRFLLVGRSALSDTDTGLGPEGGEEIALGGRPARVRDLAGLTLIAWDLPGAGQRCACDQEGFVAGRGVTRAELLAAAGDATVTGPRPSLPGRAVAGLRSLGTTTGAVWPIAVVGPLAQELTVRLASGHEVRLAVRSGDVRLLPHSRVWTPGGVDTWPGGDRRYVVRTGPAGTVVWATAPYAVPIETIEEVAASLVAATDAEVQAALDEVASNPR